MGEVSTLEVSFVNGEPVLPATYVDVLTSTHVEVFTLQALCYVEGFGILDGANDVIGHMFSSVGLVAVFTSWYLQVDFLQVHKRHGLGRNLYPSNYHHFLQYCKITVLPPLGFCNRKL